MTDHKKLIAEARKLTECECDREGAPMQECGNHGDHVALLIRLLADTLEAVTAGVETEVGVKHDRDADDRPPRNVAVMAGDELADYVRWVQEYGGMTALTRQVTPWKRVEVEG